MKNPSDSVSLPHYRQTSLHVKGIHMVEISMHHCWIGFVRIVMFIDSMYFLHLPLVLLCVILFHSSSS
jgi:hypothetical protein